MEPHRRSGWRKHFSGWRDQVDLEAESLPDAGRTGKTKATGCSSKKGTNRNRNIVWKMVFRLQVPC